MDETWTITVKAFGTTYTGRGNSAEAAQVDLNRKLQDAYTRSREANERQRERLVEVVAYLGVPQPS